MTSSYHVHTRWSDGEGEMADFTREALALGLTELGFSDHLVEHPGTAAYSWSMPSEKLPDYVAAVMEERARVRGTLDVKLGLEVDFFPEKAASLRGSLHLLPLDYVIGSVHFVDGFSIDGEASAWEALSESDRNDIIRLYWTRVRELAESSLCDLVAHMDLYRKFGCQATVDLGEEITAALDAIARHDLAFEVNTAGAYKPAGEFYPTRAIILECARRSIPVVITADAHSPAHLTRGYETARELLEQAGYRSAAVFDQRRRSSRSLR